MNFSKFAESLDADEPIGKTYTFKIQVAPGDSVTSAAIEEIDPTSTQPPAISLVTVSQVSLGAILIPVYGATFRAQGLGVAGTTYVRCRYATALGNGDDVTLALRVEQR